MSMVMLVSPVRREQRRGADRAFLAATKQRAKRRPGRPKQNFTFEEDEFILQLHDEVGLSFESIERDYFPERSTGSIKARYTKCVRSSSRVNPA